MDGDHVLVNAGIVCPRSQSACVKASLVLHLQYSAAWPNTQASVLSSKPPMGTSLALWRKSAVALVVISSPFFLISSEGVPLRLRFRAVTLPGASHVYTGGFASLYPGHTVPEVEHLLQTGRVESQTR